MSLELIAVLLVFVFLLLRAPALLLGLIVMGIAFAFLGPLGFVLGIIVLILLLK
jgi:hypothetical protein